MKHIEVVAAIIVHDGKILATQRGYGNYKGSWEFPGGKIEPGEAPEAALPTAAPSSSRRTLATTITRPTIAIVLPMVPTMIQASR